MARKRYDELTAGIFVIAALAVLIGVIVWLGGSEVFSPARQKAVFFVKEQDGSLDLQEGSFVQVGDDRVGKVAGIKFDVETGKTYYTAEIDRADVKVHSDGKAKVVAALIGGAKLVIVDRGSEQSPLADSEHPIELQGGLDQTMTDLSDAARKVNQIAETLKNELSTARSDTILVKVHEVVDSLKTASASLARLAANVEAETQAKNEQALLAKLHRSMDDVNTMTADAQPKVGEALTYVRDTAKNVKEYSEEEVADILATLRESNTEILKIARDFSTVSSQARQMVMLHRDNIDEMIDNMTQVSANLKAASKEIRRNPWRLLYKPEGKELHSQNVYDAAAAFSNGAEQLDQALSKMTGLAKASPGGIPADDPMLERIRKQLQESFDSFTKAEQALWKELNP